MKTKFLIFAMTMVFIACSKDDGPAPLPKAIEKPTPKLENRNPDSFALLEVVDEATGVDLLPTLTWNVATDPDGDVVIYDVFLSLGANPATKVAADLTTTTFSISEKLERALDYSWQVVAKDGKGGETSSAIFSFKSRPAVVVKVDVTMPFDSRNSHTSLVFQDKLWVMGGASAPGLKNDVWASSNGAIWQKIKENSEGGDDFPKRRLHTSVVFEDRIFTIGGVDAKLQKTAGVYRSDNGAEWQLLLATSEFSEVSSHTLNVFKNKMWLIGGNRESAKGTQIWSSDNGVTWKASQVEHSDFFFQRTKHTTILFNDKLWLIGGRDEVDFSTSEVNDVWNSDDGEHWVRVIENAEFAPRHSHKVVVYDDKLWLIGGQNGTASPPTEIWYSADGETWVDATPENSFNRAEGFSTVVFDNKIWILGGGVSNDVWTIE